MRDSLIRRHCWTSRTRAWSRATWCRSSRPSIASRTSRRSASRASRRRSRRSHRGSLSMSASSSGSRPPGRPLRARGSPTSRASTSRTRTRTLFREKLLLRRPMRRYPPPTNAWLLLLTRVHALADVATCYHSLVLVYFTPPTVGISVLSASSSPSRSACPQFRMPRFVEYCASITTISSGVPRFYQFNT